MNVNDIRIWGVGWGGGGGLVIDILCELKVLYYIFEIVGIFYILYFYNNSNYFLFVVLI